MWIGAQKSTPPCGCAAELCPASSANWSWLLDADGDYLAAGAFCNYRNLCKSYCNLADSAAHGVPIRRSRFRAGRTDEPFIKLS